MCPTWNTREVDAVRQLGCTSEKSFLEAPKGSRMLSSHEKIEQDPNYQELVRRRSSLGWTLSLIMLIIYFGFILLVAYAPKFLGTPLGTGVMTIGIPIGLLVIVSAFLLTGIYVSKANSKYDPLIRKIVGGNRS